MSFENQKAASLFEREGAQASKRRPKRRMPVLPEVGGGLSGLQQPAGPQDPRRSRLSGAQATLPVPAACGLSSFALCGLLASFIHSY